MADDGIRLALATWPAGAPLPRRLLALLKFMTGPSYVTLGDFEVAQLKDHYLAAMWAQDQAPTFQAYFQSTPAQVGFFAKGGDGGQVGLWMRGAPDDWPVVHIDSEGSTEILGESLEEFLRIVAAETAGDDPVEMPWSAEMSAWILAQGLTPHERPQERRKELKPLTLAFLRWSAEQQRIIRAAVLPDWRLQYDVQPGGAIGPLRVGAAQAAVDAVLGAPGFARWEKPTDPEMTAFYERSPFTVEYDRATQVVREITVYAQWALLRFPDGFEPLLATEEEVAAWLRAHHPEQTVVRQWRDIAVPALGLKLVLDGGHDPAAAPPPIRWVERVEFTAPGAAGVF